jgi:predicted ribonuclease YlaK
MNAVSNPTYLANMTCYYITARDFHKMTAKNHAYNDDILNAEYISTPPNHRRRKERKGRKKLDRSELDYYYEDRTITRLSDLGFTPLSSSPDTQSMSRKYYENLENLSAKERYKFEQKFTVPKNRHQEEYFAALKNPHRKIVVCTGPAGTGKTLMALAAGLTQVLDDRRYTEIIMTRATVSVGEDIGFLPGTEEEKMGPWMGALDDNLEFLAKGDGGNAGEWGRAATNELIRSRIKIKSMNFMRGRTFMNKYVIIDEAQNLTPKQMKTLITRAGPGTKIICMGNLAQIDTPYLTEGSSGLTYAVDRFKGWAHGGHITLARGERSRLADFASDVL